MSQPASTQPAPTAEPGTLDAVPAYERMRADDLESVRALCEGECDLTCDYTRVEEDGDGTMTIYLVGNEDRTLYAFKLPMLTGLALSTQAAETYRNADPAVRKRLLVDMTDKGYAQAQMKREREKEAVLSAARAAPPPAPLLAPPAPPAAPVAPAEGSITGLGLRRKLGRFLLGT